MTEDALEVWVIYNRPTDYPDGYVIRKWLNDRPTDMAFTAPTLDDVRKHLPRGLYRMPKDPNDDPKIVEVWL